MGGVHPAEWVFPIVGLHHLAYNEIAGAVAGDSVQLNTPGSQAAEAKSAEEDAAAQQEHQQNIAKQQAAAYLAEHTPQTDAELRDSRRRAEAARAGGTGMKRASQFLAEGGDLGAAL